MPHGKGVEIGVVQSGRPLSREAAAVNNQGGALIAVLTSGDGVDRSKQIGRLPSANRNRRKKAEKQPGSQSPAEKIA